MAALEPSTWAWYDWGLWLLGTWYLVDFFRYWFKFRRLEREIAKKLPAAVQTWNKTVQSWPGMGYAKMFGLHTVVDDSKESGAHNLVNSK